ncbi:MAG: RNA polymerase subunit sigma [Verrucomicrobia bacterium]|nr:MAG: RNA polymerase subunit sigma [Verrucomicrobiota bacterium]
MNAEDELIPTRASLLGRLKDWKDEASWKVFFETYWKLIYNAAIKAGLTDAEAQDVVQETVISVSKSMPSFEYDAVGGSFKSWLLKLTAWRIVDQKRRRDVRPAQRRSDSTTRTATVERIADPAESDLEAIWNEEWEKNLMNAAIERVKRAVDAKQYQIFDLYVLKNWPAGKVASTLKVNQGRVYLAKHRIGTMIRNEIKHLRTKPL